MTEHGTRNTHDASREQTLREDACDETEPLTEVTMRAEAYERLRQAIAKLPEQYRTIILMRQEENLTFEEIGQRLQRSCEASRMLWGRAILHLGKLMEADA